MTAQLLFYIVIGIIITEFVWDSFLNYLNSKHYNDKIPNELNDVYDADAYVKSQNYKMTNYRFRFWLSLFSLGMMLLFFIFDGFAFVDSYVRNYTDNSIYISLLFIGVIILANDVITTPFSYYQNFVIEEKFGFNKSTKMTFWLDKVKGMALLFVIGGTLLYAILWFYEKTGTNFWGYTWALMTVFSVFINMFYSSLIVPLFNKQTPLEDVDLKIVIEKFATKVGFKLNNIYVIDGSKRSSKANAYFAGFGPKKRIVLYDTLINDLENEEIVGVLAHEIGHYKKKHTLYNLVLSILTTGLMLYILSLFIDSTLLAQALGVDKPSFHIAIIAFGILYSPISEITGLLMNVLSRKFEYQADDFAKNNYDAKYLISALKKLSKNALSNLTPHSLYSFMNYSHPTLLQRIINLKNTES